MLRPILCSCSTCSIQATPTRGLFWERAATMGFVVWALLDRYGRSVASPRCYRGWWGWNILGVSLIGSTLALVFRRIFGKHEAIPSSEIVRLKDYFYGLRLIESRGPEPLCRESYQFLMTEMYSNRRDVAVVNTDGGVCKQGSEEGVNFAYSHLVSLFEEGGIVTNALESVLTGYTQTTIPKLFIPVAVFPKVGPNHAILLVVEQAVVGVSSTRISVIDPLGPNTQYQGFINRICEVAKKAFPDNSLVRSSTIQQSDGWSCGVQMLQNIAFLEPCNDVQSTVKQNLLPSLSSQDAKTIFENQYQSYVQAGYERWKQVDSAKRDQALILLKAQMESYLR